MTYTLSPSPFFKAWDNNGLPLASGKVFTYQAGTTTKAATYDSSGSTNANPIILNARGECDIWLPPNVAYKYVIAPSTDTDPPTSPIKVIDNIVNSQLITLYAGVDTGSANAYVLNFTANFSAYTDGIVLYWIPAHTNTGDSTVNVNSLGAVHIYNPDGTVLLKNQVVANQPVTMIYISGSFYLFTGITQDNTGSFTATLTGYAANPTGTVYTRRVGTMATLHSQSTISATSNATTMTMTGLPVSYWPNVSGQIVVPCSYLIDNGSSKGGTARISNSGVITFTLGMDGVATGGFTNSGTKGIGTGWCITYPLA